MHRKIDFGYTFCKIDSSGEEEFKERNRSISIQLKSILGLFLYSALFRKINRVIKIRDKAINSRHEKKSNVLDCTGKEKQ